MYSKGGPASGSPPEGESCAADAAPGRAGQPVPPYFSIYASEIRAISGNTAAWGNLETGGELFGYLTHANRAVVMLATSPGPGARHEPMHFAQDLDAFRRRCEALRAWANAQLVGTWHSHGDLDLDEPSPGDHAQVRSITSQNGYESWVEIITTQANDEPCTVVQAIGQKFRLKRIRTDSISRVRINSFVHPDPNRGEPVRCSIQVLPGLSPLRLALFSNAVLLETDLGLADCVFDMDRILHTALDDAGDAQKASRSLPPELADEISRLPFRARDALTVVWRRGLIVFSVPLGARATMNAAFDETEPHKLRAIHVASKTGGPTRDIEDHVRSLGNRLTLTEVYRVVSGMLEDAGNTPETHEREDALRPSSRRESTRGETRSDCDI